MKKKTGWWLPICLQSDWHLLGCDSGALTGRLLEAELFRVTEPQHKHDSRWWSEGRDRLTVSFHRSTPPHQRPQKDAVVMLS